MKKRIISLVLILLCMPLLYACEKNNDNRDTFTQISTIQALVKGDYYGSISVDELLSYGDIGLGTFDGLNGEMIVLDGVCYQAKYDGSIVVANANEKVPFAAVTMFDADDKSQINSITDINSLKGILNEKISQTGENSFYMARIDGTFSNMYVRSEYAQSEPYKELDVVMQTDQTEFDYENVEGTVVCVYCPEYADGVNAVGWHLHFISKDRTIGGHVLDLAFDNATITLDQTDNFTMKLPNGEYFRNLNLTDVSDESLKQVETGLSQ